jgi:hypothetical protein
MNPILKSFTMEWKTRTKCAAMMLPLVTYSRKSVLFGALFVSLLCSCHKEDSDVFISSVDNADTVWVDNSTTGAKQDFQQLLDTLVSVPDENLISNIKKNQTIDIGSDLILDLPPNGFLDNSGKVAEGPASVSILYLTSRGEMLKNKISGISNGQPLKTEFVLKLVFLQNGTELTLANNKKIEIFIKNDNPVIGNRLFTNTPAPDRSNWTDFPNGQISTISHNSKKGYSLLLGQLPWMLAGQGVNADQVTTVTATLPNIFTNANSKMYALLNDRNGIVEMGQNKNSKSFFADNIPLGSSVKVISVSSVDNNYYLGFEDLKVKNKDHAKLKPKLVSYPELIAYMNSLR